jgi:hypothetical protein
MNGLHPTLRIVSKVGDFKFVIVNDVIIISLFVICDCTSLIFVSKVGCF